jgi:hypothetical protein
MNLSKKKYVNYIYLPFYTLIIYFYFTRAISYIIISREKLFRVNLKIPLKEISWQYFNCFDFDGEINNNPFTLKIKIDNDLENNIDLYYQDINLGREIRYSQSNIQIDQMDNKVISRNIKLYKIKNKNSLLIEIQIPELYLNLETQFKKENIFKVAKFKKEGLISLLSESFLIEGRIFKDEKTYLIENCNLSFISAKE